MYNQSGGLRLIQAVNQNGQPVTVAVSVKNGQQVFQEVIPQQLGYANLNDVKIPGGNAAQGLQTGPAQARHQPASLQPLGLPGHQRLLHPQPTIIQQMSGVRILAQPSMNGSLTPAINCGLQNPVSLPIQSGGYPVNMQLPSGVQYVNNSIHGIRPKLIPFGGQLRVLPQGLVAPRPVVTAPSSHQVIQIPGCGAVTSYPTPASVQLVNLAAIPHQVMHVPPQVPQGRVSLATGSGFAHGIQQQHGKVENGNVPLHVSSPQQLQQHIQQQLKYQEQQQQIASLQAQIAQLLDGSKTGTVAGSTLRSQNEGAKLEHQGTQKSEVQIQRSQGYYTEMGSELLASNGDMTRTSSATAGTVVSSEQDNTVNDVENVQVGVSSKEASERKDVGMHQFLSADALFQLSGGRQQMLHQGSMPSRVVSSELGNGVAHSSISADVPSSSDADWSAPFKSQAGSPTSAPVPSEPLPSSYLQSDAVAGETRGESAFQNGSRENVSRLLSSIAFELARQKMSLEDAIEYEWVSGLSHTEYQLLREVYVKAEQELEKAGARSHSGIQDQTAEAVKTGKEISATSFHGSLWDVKGREGQEDSKQGAFTGRDCVHVRACVHGKEHQLDDSERFNAFGYGFFNGKSVDAGLLGDLEDAAEPNKVPNNGSTDFDERYWFRSQPELAREHQSGAAPGASDPELAARFANLDLGSGFF